MKPAIREIMRLFASLSDDEQAHVVDLIEEEYGIEIFLDESTPTHSDEKINIRVTEGAIKNGYLSIGRQFDFFPDDTIGQSSDPASRTVTLRVYGYDDVIETDVKERGTFRKRGWNRFYEQNNIRDGDFVVIERISPYEYHVYPMM